MADDGSFSYVHASEGDGSEVDGRDVLGDVVEIKVLAAEKMRNVKRRLLGRIGSRPEGGWCRR